MIDVYPPEHDMPSICPVCYRDADVCECDMLEAVRIWAGKCGLDVMSGIVCLIAREHSYIPKVQVAITVKAGSKRKSKGKGKPRGKDKA